MYTTSLLTDISITNLLIVASTSGTRMPLDCIIGKASAAFPTRHLISYCLIKNNLVVVNL